MRKQSRWVNDPQETLLCYTTPIGSKRKTEFLGALRKEKAKEMKTGTTRTDVRLRGRALFVARVSWLAFALFELILFTINLLEPLFGGQTNICPFTFTCPYDADQVREQLVTVVQETIQPAHLSMWIRPL
jgi:hypothetical protein